MPRTASAGSLPTLAALLPLAQRHGVAADVHRALAEERAPLYGGPA